MKIFKGILAQISFFTIIPSVKASLEEIAEYSFLSPMVVGVLTAFLDFIFLWLISPFFKYPLLLLFPFVEIIRGFHHLDGLLDFGDALMAKDYNKRIKALHDVEIGTGGIGMLLLYVALFLAFSLSYTSISFYGLLIAEVESRVLGLLLLALMKPIEVSYLGKVFHEKLKNWWSMTILALQSILFGNILVLISFIFLFLLFYFLGYSTLKGSSGDFVGAVITLSFPIFLILSERSCYPFFTLLLHSI